MNFKKIAAWFIIVTMVLSIAGFIGGSVFAPPASQDSLQQEYKGYIFRWENNQWATTINGQKYGFLNLPQEVEKQQLPVDVTPWRSQEKVYLIQDPLSSFSPSGSINLLQAVFSVNNVRLQNACLTEELCPDVPITTCAQPALLVKSPSPLLNETTLSSDGQCLVVQAISDAEFHRITERIIYEFLGVLQ